MALPGERLLLATTLDEVQEGDLFGTLPPHMSLVRWSNIPEHRRALVDFGLNNIFSDQYVFQDVRGAAGGTYKREDEEVRVRLMKLKEKDVKFRNVAHSLIKSLGEFDPEDQYANAKFNPHVTNTPERQVGRFESVSFRTVALFALHADDPDHIHRVLSHYQLAARENEDA